MAVTELAAGGLEGAGNDSPLGDRELHHVRSSILKRASPEQPVHCLSWNLSQLANRTDADH